MAACTSRNMEPASSLLQCDALTLGYAMIVFTDHGGLEEGQDLPVSVFKNKYHFKK